jgi:hypothetical protein
MHRWQLASCTASWLPLLAQLHLAFFYLRGVYFDAAKRFSGSRMVYIGNLTTQRKYYGIMGILLLLQLIAGAVGKLRCDLASKRDSSCAHVCCGSIYVSVHVTDIDM